MKWPESLVVLERGWLSSNNIVFLGDEPAVVDTSYVTHGDHTLRLIDQALDGQPLRRIVNTHLHSDHAGGNALLQARHEVRTWIPPGDSGLVDTWDEDGLSYRRTSQQCPRFTYDALIHPGDTLSLGGEDWRVLPAPGHDHAMVMLWCERQGILVSADALWRHGFGVIFPELAGIPGFEAQAGTLALIESLQPRAVIPGHGAPFFEADGAVTAALQAARSRLRWLQDDPQRHVHHALKVLLAFKLLEVQRLDRAAITDIMGACLHDNPGLHALSASGALAPEALATSVAQELVRSGVACWEDGLLVARSV